MADKLVIDCSVAAKWVLPEPDSEKALTVLERYQTGEYSLIAPDLLLAEFGSLIGKRFARRQLSVADARRAFLLMTRCSPRLFDMRPLLESALELSLQLPISVWDAVYIALALQHHCELITADRRLFISGGPRHPNIRLLDSFA